MISSKVLLTLLSHIQLLRTGTSFQAFKNPFYYRMVPRQATLQLHSAQLRNKVFRFYLLNISTITHRVAVKLL